MPSKTRLNKDMRHMLLRLARDRVKAPKEAEATFIATHKVFDKEIRRICKGLYPKRDMEVLKKYHAAHQQPFIDLIVPGEVPRFDRFHFVGHSWETARSGTTDLPWVPKHIEHGRVNLDERASVAFQAYASAAAEREMARNELLGTFETAIRNAKNLEEIEAVWPAAREARVYAPPSVPAVILSTVFDRMREAVEQKNA
jgi:hypothetical protein